MSEKYTKTCKYFNYVQHLILLASVICRCASISASASLVYVLVGNTSSP